MHCAGTWPRYSSFACTPEKQKKKLDISRPKFRETGVRQCGICWERFLSVFAAETWFVLVGKVYPCSKRSMKNGFVKVLLVWIYDKKSKDKRSKNNQRSKLVFWRKKFAIKQSIFELLFFRHFIFRPFILKPFGIAKPGEISNFQSGQHRLCYPMLPLKLAQQKKLHLHDRQLEQQCWDCSKLSAKNSKLQAINTAGRVVSMAELSPSWREVG